jgi:hypothetical protein
MTRTLLNACCLTLQRLSLSVWVGAAILFVITSVAEQVAPQFTPVIRDQLATIRFPWYYRMCAMCLGLGFAASLGVVVTTRGPRRGAALILVLVLTSVVIVMLDYHSVYRPLLSEITPPGKPRSPEFVVLHERSRRINVVHVGLAAVAATLACSARGSRT